MQKTVHLGVRFFVILDMRSLNRYVCALFLALAGSVSVNAAENIVLDSRAVHGGSQVWKMKNIKEVDVPAEKLSCSGFDTSGWMDAVVPGTVLTSLVRAKVYPDPYYGVNNKLESELIPDISKVGRDFYSYWFRTEFELPQYFQGKNIWLHPMGINYRAEFWLNGHLVCTMGGMFNDERVNVTEFVKVGGRNALAVKVLPVDEPGNSIPKRWGAVGEFQNGGNGNIGVNTTMLMTVGWDFTFMDGIRDRNTGIWKSIELYATGRVDLRNPFVQSELNAPDYNIARETICVEVVNPGVSMDPARGELVAEIPEAGIRLTKKFDLFRGGEKTITFSPEEFPELVIENPRLWWPVNKGPQELYTLKLTAYEGGKPSASVTTRFGIREITSDQNTPDRSRLFYVNGHPLFVRGTNWIPEAMLRTDDQRMEDELLLTRQSGVNLLRLWAGGIAESDRFYELCDEYGLLVWQEFWMTGDTRHPRDKAMYFANVESTIKRIRNHPALAYYVGSNESTEMPGMRDFVNKLDPTRGYQMQSECDGVHDGSPYKQVNPMQHYTNTASDRGSRIDGFNPEYGAPTMPLVESLRRMMPQEDLWPVNKATWDYLDGNGFHLMTSLYAQMTDCYGKSSSIEEYARKGQLVGAMNSKSIWECWNENKLGYGDRWCSGLLFWYHNNPMPQVCARLWDYYLEPTASLYHTANALEPLHIQFDYLKNTVSVVNDYYQPFEGLTAKAEIYDLNSRKVSSASAKVSVPADGVANDVLTLSFPRNITQVHFISLTLSDAKGKVVSRNFYWRSKDEYKGKPTVTGPATSGFESLSDMPKVQPSLKVSTSTSDGKLVLKATVANNSGRISFFNQLKLQDGKGNFIQPSVYSDNFFTLLPGESRTITIQTRLSNIKGDSVELILEPYNGKKQSFTSSFKEDKSNFWAIDMTVLKVNGKYYGIWSGWDKYYYKSEAPEQWLFIAPMTFHDTKPYVRLGKRAVLSKPELPFEMKVDEHISLLEGPGVLYHGDDIFVLYSCRGSWTENYKMGQLKLKKGCDPMRRDSWEKKTVSVFRGVYPSDSLGYRIGGVGHASFTTSPDDTQNWIYYHSMSVGGQGWGSRYASVQKFTFDENGDPVFGVPTNTAEPVERPSGELEIEKSEGNASPSATFRNPVYRGPDPWVTKVDGKYYMIKQKDNMSFIVTESPYLSRFSRPGGFEQNAVEVYRLSGSHYVWNSHQLWAPELHCIEGKWYIFYAAGQQYHGPFWTQRTGVLVSENGPFGPYVESDVKPLFTGE